MNFLGNIFSATLNSRKFSGVQELILFSLIILLAATLRFTGICFDSLWLDESYQSMVGAFGHGPPNFTQPRAEKFLFKFENPASTAEVLSQFRSVDPLCPPLYAVLLNYWMKMFSGGDLAVRSLSALLSTLSVSGILFFCKSILNSRAAIFAGLLAAISPFAIHYAQEARMYSLVEFCAVLSGCSLILILKNDSIRQKTFLLLTLYIVSTWAMINSHYTSLFLAAAEGGCAVLYLLWKRRWALLLWLSLSWAATLLLWIPWLSLFLVSANSRKESFYVAREGTLLWPFYALFVRIPVNWLTFICGQRVVAYAVPTYAGAAIFLANSLIMFLKPSREKFALGALWLWALVPALGLWLIDTVENHRVIEVARYTIFSAPAIFMLAGYGLSELISWRKFFIWLALIQVFFASVNLIYTHTVHQREPWKEMAATVEQLVNPDELLLISQHYDLACLNRYLTKPRLQQGVSPAMGQEQIANIVRNRQSFALITAQDGESIKSLIPTEFKLIKKVDYSHGLHLRLFQKE